MGEVPTKKRGVSFGLLGVLFFFAMPVGLLVAWFHPAFRHGNERDPLLRLTVDVYVAMVTALNVLSVFEESWPEPVSQVAEQDRR
jgi:hypothetical protein